GEKTYAGGICAFAENAFIMQNVSLCPQINGSGISGAVVGTAEVSEVSDNYSCDRMRINSKKITEEENSGKLRSLASLKDFGFYYKPLADGGLLGWSSDRYGGDTWSSISQGSGYAFPTLIGVAGQNTFVMPKYEE
ncbi:MAG: hypothetical protein PUE13_01590, partial [Clostridiales bacterium]|nr:hypothetical protein [Clostridiales bacterium]